MEKALSPLFSVFLLTFLCIFTTPLLANKAEKTTSYQSKLDNIREKITNVLTELNKTQNKRSNVRNELQKLEITIARTSKSLRYTKRKHQKSAKNLKRLKNELTRLKTKLNAQRALLSDQLRSAYAMGNEPQLKLMLNQQKPTEMGRSMIYFDYLNKARTTEISDYLQSIKEKQTLESNIKATVSELKKLVDKKLAQKKDLSHHRLNRKRLLSKLNKDINGQQLTLTDLKQSRSRIEQLLMSLGEILADIPNIPIGQKPFAQLKKHLPWPVRGKFSAKFGTSRNTGDLTWNGVVIDSDYGRPVRAITHGRIVFADWLQGYGFITIIDHNDGYLSLYGHNQAQFKQAGEWVEAGETIATVGDSGGQPNSGLYFEIRHQGKPINPDQWCSTKIRHVALKDNKNDS
jgi:murein hydrolase activator